VADGGLYIGIEIGGTKLQLVAGDASARVLDRVRITADRATGAAGIRTQIEAGLRKLAAWRDLAGVGVGFGGPVNPRTGRIARSHQVEGWEGFSLRDWLAELAGGAPVTVENDSNCATVGEALDGAGRGFDTVFYCNFGSGVGGGLVTRGGVIYHGAPPGEMEFGHLRLGRGQGETVESRCSGWAVDARIRAHCAEGPRDSALARLVALDPGSEARHLACALAANDEVANRIVLDLADDIALALSHVVHLAHPEVIVLGGGLSLIGDALCEGVGRTLPRYMMKAFHPPPLVRLAELREDAVPVGALHLAAARGGRAAEIRNEP
jgi:glucokinase